MIARIGRRRIWALLFAVVLTQTACVTSAPKQVDNVCKIFTEKRSWYKEAAKAAERWQGNVPIIMAIMHQESRFIANARPARKKILGFIPGFRPSNSYGYSQAKKETWRWYVRESGRFGAQRRDFGDSADFIGWYNRKSSTVANIAANDAYALYLAYHEGHGGYMRRSFQSKSWLKGVALKVQRRAAQYQMQLNDCEEKLKKRRWWFFG